jgi:polyhydroxyalkanoate synthesis regulator phasin
MAKKKSASRAEAVREAAEQAFKAQIPRERISELLDELGSTAGRLRGAVDELRPASEADVKSLRAEVRALIKRVEALESEPAKPKPKPKPRRKPAATAAAKPAAPRARKPPAARPPAAES